MKNNVLGLNVEIKTVDTTERTIEGYAAIAHTVDRVNDIIDQKAFNRVQGKDPAQVAVFVGHDMSRLPVGIPVEIRYDGIGLYTKTKVFNTSAGDDLLTVAAELKAHGMTLGQSIGYKVMPGGAQLERIEGKTIRRLTDLDIKEYSYAHPTTIAHPDALVTNVKAMSEGDFNGAGGILTQEVLQHLKAAHKQHCKDPNCTLRAAGLSDDDDDDDSKTIIETASYNAWGETVEFKRDYDADTRKKYAKEGVAMADGSYPIPDKDALGDAIQAFGRSKNKAATKRHIVKRARALGAMDALPDKWMRKTAMGAEHSTVDPMFVEFFQTKCMGDGGYGTNDIWLATNIINSLSEWVEHELDEGEESATQARALYRALVLVVNTLRSEVGEYYGSDHSDGDNAENTDAGAGVDDEGGKTLDWVKSIRTRTRALELFAS